VGGFCLILFNFNFEWIYPVTKRGTCKYQLSLLTLTSSPTEKLHFTRLKFEYERGKESGGRGVCNRRSHVNVRYRMNTNCVSFLLVLT
jgi:hypothetical protein